MVASSANDYKKQGKAIASIFALARMMKRAPLVFCLAGPHGQICRNREGNIQCLTNFSSHALPPATPVPPLATTALLHALKKMTFK